MIQKQTIFAATAVLMLFLSISAIAQIDSKMPAERTYEVMLQVLSTSRERKSDVPSNLSAAVKKLKSTMDVPDLGLEASYIERTSAGFSYKGSRSFVPQGQMPGPENYCEWGFRIARGPAEQSDSLMIDGFRFGMKFAVAVQSDKKEDRNPVAYEWFGINDLRFRLPVGEPTLVGTINGVGTDERIFIFMTARPVA